MSETYLVECTCGKSIPVRQQQAGEEIECACGQPVRVPNLGRLRQCPRAEQAATPAATHATWDFSRGITFSLGALICLISLGVLVFLFSQDRRLVVEPPKLEQLVFSADPQSWSPAESYQAWKEVQTFELRERDDPYFVINRRWRRLFRIQMAVAGVFLIGGLVAIGWSLVPRGPRARHS